MVKFTALFLACCAGLFAQAQTSSRQMLYSNTAASLYDQQRAVQQLPSATVSPLYLQPTAPLHVNSGSKGRKMKIIGMTLTGLGAVMIPSGILLVRKGRQIEDDYRRAHPHEHKVYDGGSQQMFGSLMFIAGSGAIITGSVLWIRGAKKHKDYLLVYPQSLRLDIRSSGPALCYRF